MHENGKMCDGEFAAFKVLWNAIPMSEQSAELICSCLNHYVGKSGKSIRELEKILARYKLERMEKLEK